MRRSSTNRAGFTILEVLFAILVVAIGLLGAIAVFPVASEAARKGRLNDELTVLGDTATHKFDAQGMRAPEKWVAYLDGSASNQQPQAYPGLKLAALPGFWRTSFCLDPRFTAENQGAHPISEQEWTYFPAYPKAFASSPRMQRITLVNGASPALPMSRFQADYVFSFEDHLQYDRPKDNSLPATQIYASPFKDANGKLVPTKREDDGKLSWMATLSPKLDQFNGTASDLYTVSIVLFDKRSPVLRTTSAFSNEWTVNIAGSDFYSTGFGGGEVRLNSGTADRLDLKSGQWLMLMSNAAPVIDKPTGNVLVQSAPIFKWYRVSDTDEVDTAVINGFQKYVQNVTLIGPDWDLQDANSDGTPDDVEVAVVPGIVQVLERTVRLEF